MLGVPKQTTTAISVLMQDMEEAFVEGALPTEAYQALLEHDFGSTDLGSGVSHRFPSTRCELNSGRNR